MSRKEEALLMSLQHAVDMALGSPEVSTQYMYNGTNVKFIQQILCSNLFTILNLNLDIIRKLI